MSHSFHAAPGAVSFVLPLLILLFVVVFIAVFGGIVFLIVRSARKNLSREKAVPALASALGLRMETGTYPPGVPPFAETAGFALFRNRDTPSITNVMHGRLGSVDAQLFDFSYFEHMGVGRNREATRFDHWVAMLTADGFALPSSIDVAPRNFLDRVAASLGRETITFAEYPELSHQYVFGRSTKDSCARCSIPGRRRGSRNTRGFASTGTGGNSWSTARSRSPI